MNIVKRLIFFITCWTGAWHGGGGRSVLAISGAAGLRQGFLSWLSVFSSGLLVMGGRGKNAGMDGGIGFRFTTWNWNGGQSGIACVRT